MHCGLWLWVSIESQSSCSQKHDDAAGLVSPKTTACCLRPLQSVCCLFGSMSRLNSQADHRHTLNQPQSEARGWTRRPSPSRRCFRGPRRKVRHQSNSPTVQASCVSSVTTATDKRPNQPTQSAQPRRSIDRVHTHTRTAWFPPLETGEVELLGQLEAQLEQRLLAIQTTPAPPPLGVVDGRAGDEEDEEEEEREVGRLVYLNGLNSCCRSGTIGVDQSQKNETNHAHCR